MKLTNFSVNLAVVLSLAMLSITSEGPISRASNSSSPSALSATQTHVLTDDLTLPASPEVVSKVSQDDSQTIHLQYASVAGVLTGGAIVIVLLGIAAIVRPKEVLGLVRVPDDKVGIVIKHLSRPVPSGQLIALNGEAGPQADTLSSGWHFFYWPWMYRVNLENIVIIAEDEIGWVEAKDGKAGERGQQFRPPILCNDFQDGRAFLSLGGQRGKQQAILTPGSYRINTALFDVHNEKIVQIKATEVGLVEAKDGAPLDQGRSLVTLCIMMHLFYTFHRIATVVQPSSKVTCISVFRTVIQ